MPKYLDQTVLTYAITNLAQSISNNFAMRKNAIRSLKVVMAIPTGSTLTTPVKCLEITYDDDGYVNKAGATVSHVVYLDINELAFKNFNQWTVGESYDVDDYVVYNNKLYKCLALHTAVDFNTDKANWVLEIGDEQEYVFVADDYSALPSTPVKDVVYCCKRDFVDTSVTPSVTYASGLYLYDTTTSKYVQISSSGSGTGSAELDQNVQAIGVSVGGVNDGDVLPKGMTFTQFAIRLLQKRIPPTYTNPTISLITSKTGVHEKGTPNFSVVITPTFTQNDAGTVTGYELFRNGVSIYKGTSIAKYTDTIPTLTNDLNYTCIVTYATGAVKNDNMGDPDPTGQIMAGSITGSATTIKVALRYYYGTSASDTSILLSTLGNKLDIKKNMTFTFTSANEYIVIAYDSSYGNLTSILDVSSFENLGSFNMTTLTSGGYTYNVYTTATPVTCTNFDYTIKF